jgi:putative ABC transport system permease protein
VKGGAGRLHRGLTIAVVALTFVLLAGSGLLIRSFLKLQSVDKGFAERSTVTMSIQLDARYSQAERQNAFFRDLVGKTNALPGVEAAAAVNYLPLGGGESLGGGLQVEGRAFDEKTLFEDRAITPRYFAAMGIPLVSGRAFTDGDVAGRPLVAIVNRSFARRYFPGLDPVGKRCRNGDNRWWTIVGVAGDVRHMDLETTPPIQIYRREPACQWSVWPRTCAGWCRAWTRR